MVGRVGREEGVEGGSIYKILRGQHWKSKVLHKLLKIWSVSLHSDHAYCDCSRLRLLWP